MVKVMVKYIHLAYLMVIKSNILLRFKDIKIYLGSIRKRIALCITIIQFLFKVWFIKF
jgi:hypothetical protein